MTREPKALSSWPFLLYKSKRTINANFVIKTRAAMNVWNGTQNPVKLASLGVCLATGNSAQLSGKAFGDAEV